MPTIQLFLVLFLKSAEKLKSILMEIEDLPSYHDKEHDLAEIEHKFIGNFIIYKNVCGYFNFYQKALAFFESLTILVHF